MSIDTLIFGALSPLVGGRVYPDVAPEGAECPRIVYQQIGGQSLNFTEGTLPESENGHVQVAVWGLRRLEVADIAKRVEEALLGVADLQVSMIGGRASTYEPDTKLYGARQDFSIWAPR